MARPPQTGPTAEVHRLMGEASAAFGRGDHRAAARGAEEALKLSPGMPEALHLLGLCHLQHGDAQEALRLLREAAERKPSDAQLMHHLGIACAEAGDGAGALAAFTRATVLDARNPESWFNLAVLAEERGETEASERAYREALKLAPRHARAMAGLAAILEQQSALEEAAEWCGKALTFDASDPVANLTQAQVDFRSGREATAASRLEALLKTPLTPRNRALAAGRLGAVYDRLGKVQEAWDMFLTAKRALGETSTAPPQDGIYTFDNAARLARHADALLARGPAMEGPAPVFLVGFPRSGTTLLDQILSGHPGLAVLEEKDTLQDVLREHALSEAGMQAFLKLDAAGLEQRRRTYWHRVAEFMPARAEDKRFVDKLPLNSLYLPLLKRLFPNARFIFALRDPRDVVLSCFMQSFELNEAMRHFLSLDETARWYAAVMGVACSSLGGLADALHRVRYEDVVADTEGEARRLLAFLGLPWDPGVLEFPATAKRRRISTPSYHQVARPIYTSSRERWRQYEPQLAPVMPVLEPFIRLFGYR